jgi:two-component system chemotaxis response regulator CheY
MQILLAEDDRISRDLLRRIIESERQHSLTVAADGEEAWTHLQDTSLKFDVCILDICMPGLGGLDLLERIRASDTHKDLPVIFCTADHDRASVQRAGQLGVSHYVLKPYTRTVMVEKLKQIKTSRPALDPLEAADIVCKRLGIDAEMHRAMIESLVEDVTAWCERLRGATEPGELQKLFIRGRGIKGSCMSLGARRVAQEMAALESVLQTYFSTASASAASAGPGAASLSGLRLQGPLDNVEREIAIVGDWIKAVA